MILAVHIADAVLRTEWWAGAWVVALALVFVSIYRLDAQELPRLAMLTSVFFVSSSVHVPLGGVSVHLLFTGLVGVMAGWRSGLVVAVGLFLQSWLIGHGGLQSLGFNIVIMSLPAIIVGAIYSRLVLSFRKRQLWQSLLAFGAGSLGVALTIGLGFVGLRFGAMPEIQPMTWAFAVAHVPIMGIEGFLTAAVLSYLNRVTPVVH